MADPRRAHHRTMPPTSSPPARSDVTTLFVSMSARHPEGQDADYLEWHTFDHRPEQQRLASLRTSVRRGVDARLSRRPGGQ